MFTLFIAPTNVHEQLSHELPCGLVIGAPLRGDGSIFASVVAANLEADPILGRKGTHWGLWHHQIPIYTHTNAVISFAHRHQHAVFFSSWWSIKDKDMVRRDSTLTHWCWQSAPADGSPAVFTLEWFSVCLSFCIWMFTFVSPHTCGCVTPQWAVK